MHTLLDLHGNIPTFIRITDGRVHGVNILDEFFPEAGAFIQDTDARYEYRLSQILLAYETGIQR